MNRRRFIQRNGLWLTGALAFPAIVRAQVLPSARRIATPTPNSSVSPIADLVAWWKLNDGSGTSAADSTGNGFTGTLFNTPAWGTGGPCAGCLTFVSASSQYVGCGNISYLESVSTCSVSAWVSRADTGKTVLIGTNSGGTNRTNFLLYSDGKLYFQVGNSSAGQYYSVATSITGWHHIGFVFNGSLVGNARFKGYIDGSPVTLTYNATPPATTASSIQGAFRMFYDGSTYYNGSADEVRVYSSALTDADMAQLYNYPCV